MSHAYGLGLAAVIGLIAFGVVRVRLLVRDYRLTMRGERP